MKEKEEYTFTYQDYRMRWFLFIPCVILLSFLLNRLGTLIQNEIVYYVIGLGLLTAGYFLLFKVTENVSFVNKKGTCVYEDRTFTIHMDNRSTSFKEVNELYARTKKLGLSPYVLLQIRSGGKLKVIYSSPLKKGQDMSESDVIGLENFILKKCGPMKTVHKDNPYWYEK